MFHWLERIPSQRPLEALQCCLWPTLAFRVYRAIHDDPMDRCHIPYWFPLETAWLDITSEVMVTALRRVVFSVDSLPGARTFKGQQWENGTWLYCSASRYICQLLLTLCCCSKAALTLCLSVPKVSFSPTLSHLVIILGSLDVAGLLGHHCSHLEPRLHMPRKGR